MEGTAKHVVASTQEDGTVRLESAQKTVTLQSSTLAALYAAGEAQGGGSQDTRPNVFGRGVREGQDLLTTQPWRRAAVSAAASLIEKFEERSDIDMEDCPIYDELKDIVSNAATDANMDEQRTDDLLHAGQMVLFICDNDDDL